MSRFIATALCLFALAWMPRASPAQVRQCIATDGTQVYTDRKCEDIGGRERLPAAASGGMASARGYRASCARSVQDLAYSLSNAIQSGDANQIAGVYDWTGMSTETGYRLFARLEALAKRPLMDVQPVYAGGTNEYGDAVIQFDDATGEVVSKPPQKPRLIGLRVEQTLGSSATPARTVFGLRKSMGCWWVRL